MKALWLLLATLPASGSMVFSSAVDSGLFHVTEYYTGVSTPGGMIQNPGGSIYLQSSSGFGPGLLHLMDLDLDGVADGPGTVVATVPSGYLNHLVDAGSYVIQTNFRFGTLVTQILEKGAAPSDPLTEAASFTFTYPAGWLHPTPGITIRETPGVPGSYDLVFNVGSQFNAASSTEQVSSTGLINANLDGESLYMVTLNLSGGTPTASHLTKIATGIRNVFGLSFAANGDLYFSENAIDAVAPSSDPPQADELNRIAAAELGVTVPDFGFPDCYPDYLTGSTVGSGCVDPVAAFTPLGTTRSQGPAGIAFAPSSFPSGFNNGVFVGFSGRNEFDRNPLVFYDFDTSTYIHFVDEGMIRVLGLLSTPDALFVADWNGGTVYRITAAVPEPSTLTLATFTLLILIVVNKRRQRV